MTLMSSLVWNQNWSEHHWYKVSWYE